MKRFLCLAVLAAFSVSLAQAQSRDDVRGDPAPTEAVDEGRRLRQALEHCGGNVAATARLLGMKRSTLYDRLRRCGLRTPPRSG